MNRTPALLGAITAAMFAGGVFGATTNTTPLYQDAADPLASLPQHDYAQPAAAAQTRPAQDSYAMRTPDGIVPVGELALRRLENNRPDAAIAQPTEWAEPVAYREVRAGYAEDTSVVERGEPLEPVGNQVARLETLPAPDAGKPVHGESQRGGSRLIRLAPVGGQ